MNTALEYSTRVVQEGGRRYKKSTLNDLVHLTPLRIPLMNPLMVGLHCKPDQRQHILHFFHFLWKLLNSYSLHVMFRLRKPRSLNFYIRPAAQLVLGLGHGLINYIDTKSKCHLQKLTCKGTLRQVFVRV
jgi:hypothetical protein